MSKPSLHLLRVLSSIVPAALTLVAPCAGAEIPVPSGPGARASAAASPELFAGVKPAFT